MRAIWRGFSGFRKDRRGAAAAEFAILLPALIFPLLNITDVAVYAFDSMQVQNAAQLGAQQAWNACGTKLEFSGGCTGLSAQVTAAIQTTSLGTGVTQVGAPTVGYYCATTAGTLSLVATPPTAPPSNCNAVAGASDPTATPGGYVAISVTYSFTPVFSGPLSVFAILCPSSNNGTTCPITPLPSWTRSPLSS